MTNPEFKRNLWLEFSSARLILMPALLAVIGVLVAVLTKAEELPSILLLIFAVIGSLLIMGWGSFAVMHSINSEITERTWDQQRLSALGPWQMMWGKLFGAPAYAWYGGLMCAAVVLATGLMGSNPIRVGLLLLATLIATVALHGWLLASRLHTMDASKAGSSAVVQRLFGLFILLQTVPALVVFAISQRKESDMLASWWGFGMGFPTLWLLLSTFALALGLLAAWRSMAKQLMVRTIPWAWLLGCAAIGMIIAGFADGPKTAYLWPFIVALTALGATYFALFTEKNNGLIWRAVAYHAAQGNGRRFLQSLPLWPVSWLLALLCAVFYTLFVFLAGRQAEPSSDMVRLHAVLLPVLWMALLHALRDVGIYLFFAWRNTTRKPAGMALLVYVVVGYVLPMFFGFGSGKLGQIFEPFTGISISELPYGQFFSSLAWISMFVQIAIVAGLLVWRWNQSGRLQAQPVHD